MKKLPVIALGGLIAAAVGGTAIAAASNSHVMNVPLADGSVARIEYVGDVPPKVTVAPAPVPGFGDVWRSGLPPLGDLDRVFEQIDRQMRAVEQMASQPGRAAGMNLAGYGNLPAGMSSVSVVSTSNGAVACTRTTEVVSQGPGKPPKVTTEVSGNCGAGSPLPAPSAAPGAVNRT